MCASVLTNPLGIYHPQSLAAAAGALESVLAVCWPRVASGGHAYAIVEAISLCWLNLSNAPDIEEGSRHIVENLKHQVRTIWLGLSELMKAAGMDPVKDAAQFVRRQPILGGLLTWSDQITC